jgi:hypothetical protein
VDGAGWFISYFVGFVGLEWSGGFARLFESRNNVLHLVSVVLSLINAWSVVGENPPTVRKSLGGKKWDVWEPRTWLAKMVFGDCRFEEGHSRRSDHSQ